MRYGEISKEQYIFLSLRESASKLQDSVHDFNHILRVWDVWLLISGVEMVNPDFLKISTDANN